MLVTAGLKSVRTLVCSDRMGEEQAGHLEGPLNSDSKLHHKESLSALVLVLIMKDDGFSQKWVGLTTVQSLTIGFNRHLSLSPRTFQVATVWFSVHSSYN